MTTKNKGRKKSLFFGRRLQRKILIPFLILIVFTGSVIGFVSYEYSVNTTTEELTNNVESQMAGMNDSFELFFNHTDSTLNRLTSNELLLHYSPDERDALFQSFKETGDANEAILNIYTGIDETGEVIIYPDADLGDDFNPKERSWYQEAMEAEGSTIWTEPYTDEATGETIVSAAQAYYDNHDELIGVVSADVSVNTLLTMINEVEIGDSGYAVLFDQSGNYLAHPDESYIGQDVSEEGYYQEIENAGEQGTFSYQFDGEDRLMAFAQNSTTGWTIAGTVNQGEIDQQAQGILIPIVITEGVLIVLAVVISFMITRRITKPINMVMNRMKQIANGDLSEEPLKTTSRDEIGQLVTA
ncbi:HAMP domain-containing protein, partial [Lentibacillus halodurans]